MPNRFAIYKFACASLKLNSAYLVATMGISTFQEDAIKFEHPEGDGL